jgi:hypothetical protein
MSQLSYDQSQAPAAIGKRGSQTAGACITVFMLPFIAAGIGVMSIGVGGLRSGAPTQQWLAPLLFGAAFATFAIGFIAIAFVGMRNASADVAMRAQNPDQPWRWRKDWAEGVIVDRSGAAGAFLFVFAIIWNAISLTVVWFLLNGTALQRQPALWVVVIFPAIGAILIVAAIYRMLRRHKYGESRLTLDRHPIAPGATFRGEVDTHVSQAPEDGFAIRLMCVHRVTTGGSDRSTVETIVWADEQTVSAGAAMRSPVGTRVPFTFTVPDDARPTDERLSNDEIVWRIAVRANVPGIDYAAIFEIPVFGTAGTPHAPTHYAVAPAAAASWTPAAGSRITIEPYGDGGEEVRVATRASGQRLALVSITVIWLGVIALLFLKGVFLFGVIFSIFGALLLLAMLDAFTGRSVIRASTSALSVRRVLPFGTLSTQTFTPDQIESITANLELSSAGAASRYSVDLTLRGGAHVRAASSIRERRDADTLAARLLRDIGRA